MSTDELVKIFGEHSLISPSNGGAAVKPADALEGKVVMLYFSAHWCPPCRQFTPKLIEFYNNLKANNNAQDFELIYVTMDNTEAEFTEYTANMPWLCVSYTFPDKHVLATKFKAQGIPHLVVVESDSERSIITMEGTTEVQVDASGSKFPWRSPVMAELMPAQLLTQTPGQMVAYDSLKDKYLMLYFSAHWCPPCRGFTPILSKAYSDLMAAPDVGPSKFELVFVSSDQDEKSFTEYFAEMTFCALPYADREAKNAISKRFGISGIPSLLILGPVDPSTGDRPLINDSFNGSIESGNHVADFPFEPKPFGDLANIGEEINEQKCLMVFHESGDDDEQAEVMDAIKAAATSAEAGDEVKYFWALDDKGLIPRIRQALEMTSISDDPTMVLVDLPDEGSYYKSSVTDITPESILKFVKNPGTKHSISG
mmetsp:Transcript_18421/g.33367  ORF Transcript_18421/g.33367 Transcript_18421/m.33367 type:complete len:426 (-) Transcript_18421:192-1469(-)|eukprot:CAMPEP_0198285326 /NCGR_PEP_ID=MMETSP1449-20131203/4659_1 /TAXON_ID=420275 /ORGANISM="Attheya septentrionalis, Strain CCMP2084" /LENGTH=425 /DNA_ID=CAMNT_0043982731 /DNA_START=60 /DNA_END=1337 /DNA_ORIENTATION=-